MTHLKWPLMLAVALGLVVFVAACGAVATVPPAPTLAAGSQATTAPTAQPTATTAPTQIPPSAVPPTQTPTTAPTAAVTATATTGQILNPQTLSQTANLDSFRSTTEMSWQGTMTNSVQASGSFTMSVEYVRQPPAQHLKIAGDAPFLSQSGLANGKSMEMYVVNNTMYLNLGGTWINTPIGSQPSTLDNLGLFKAEDVLKDVNGAKYVGEETINGIRTKHYTFDQSGIDASQVAPGGKIDKAQGDVYVAVNGDYVVRMVLSMTGSNLSIPSGTSGQDRLSNGTLNMTINVSDVNQPITITVPPEAKGSGG